MSELEKPRALPLFHGIRDSDFEAILPFLKQKEFKEKEAVFFRGAPGISMFILLSGYVDVTLTNDGGIRGKFPGHRLSCHAHQAVLGATSEFFLVSGMSSTSAR